ncbi:uncharacterized protein ACLA_098870 [Aspergillus clavatus NRRL 1]|uniref:C6 transcription factor n=1 Tax=Aspergillus clavatus (strain ATCC 1007 / CBS 513.65 / DSM 816 / NCTC 3887 / NRRL 1 / QM 1276 / 107) TaxID=344612 RepID=A1CN08_ASPCL|nr:uncharacterized protein ACLA_098870 [Aspergillus clavatus NRRL 1]EAW08945.1 hypothetical protein ACLA_098870 [Aspergillus clavatus NRRL 1]
MTTKVLGETVQQNADTGPALLPEAASGNTLNWDWQLYTSDFGHSTNEGESTGGNAQQAYHPVESHRLRDKGEIPGPSEIGETGLGTREKVAPVQTGTDELLRLQSQLSHLLSDAAGSSTGHPPAVDEVLLVCKDLLELLQKHSASFSAAGLCHGDQRARSNPSEMSCITVSRVATSYAYALQLLDLSVDSLTCQTSTPSALVSLGHFNLASQPAMGTSIVAYIISVMVHRLRDAITLLTPEGKGNEELPQRTPPPYPSPAGGTQTTTTTSPIHTAVNMVAEKEIALLRRLSKFIINR